MQSQVIQPFDYIQTKTKPDGMGMQCTLMPPLVLRMFFFLANSVSALCLVELFSGPLRFGARQKRSAYYPLKYTTLKKYSP